MDEIKEKSLEKMVATTNPANLTLEDLKEYMRVDFVDPDNDRFIETILISAKSFVQTYLGWRFEEWTHGDVPPEITIATLAIGEHWYKNRGVLTEDISKQELPFVFAGILDMHRNWQVAGVEDNFLGGYSL